MKKQKNVRRVAMDEFDLEAERAGKAIININDFRPRYKVNNGKRTTVLNWNKYK